MPQAVLRESYPQSRMDSGFEPDGRDELYRVIISEDPVGLAGGINLYAYVGNQPINRKDPSGLHMVCDQIHGCYFHTSCISNHEHPNGDHAEGTCFNFDPPLNLPPIPPWVCKMGIKAGCNLLCKRLGGDLATCQATCTAAAELVCPKKCE